MRKFNLIHCFLVLAMAILTLGSCKKGEAPAQSIVGTWMEPASPTGSVRNVIFLSNGTFQATFMYYAADPANNVSTTFNGSYSVRNDNLSTSITKITQQDKNGITYPAVEPAGRPLYESATFRINTNVLTINYTTYPADAPVATEAKFNRFIPD